MINSLAKRYYFENKEMLDLSTRYIPQPNYSEFVEASIFNVFFSTSNKQDEIIFYVGVQADILVKGYAGNYRNRNYDEDTKTLKLTLTFKATLSNGLKNLKNIDIDDYSKKPYNESTTLSKYLVPYISTKGMERKAQEFLEEYCPEVFNKPMKTPVDKILSKMNLRKYNSPLPDDIFGRTYFEDSDEQIYNENGSIVTQKIRKGSILINGNISFMESVGSENNTVIHECIHWKYHKNFFELQHLLNPNEKFMSCTVVDKYIKNGSLTAEIEWMEWQANQLAPRILMPANTTLQKYKEIMEELANDFPQLPKSQLCEFAIKILADFFDVSQSAMKVRLAQLGIKEAVGAYCYVNGKYQKPYQFNHEKSDEPKTYLIGFVDALLLYLSNKTLAKLVDEKKIVFANGFYALNNQKYVKLTEEGILDLTDYAREHVDECCLEFDIIGIFKTKHDGKYYSMCFLCRNASSDGSVRVEIDEASIQNSRIIGITGSMNIAMDEINEASELLSKMNDNFVKSINLLFENSTISSVNELATLSNIDHKTISSYLDGKTIPDLRKLLAICSAMELYPVLSYRLIEQAGLSIGKRGAQIDMVYMFLLDQCYHEGLDKWNERIKLACPTEFLP